MAMDRLSLALSFISIVSFILCSNASEGGLRHDHHTQDTSYLSELSYLILGESVSLGSTLENHNEYPTLLSPNAKNLAMRALGPKVPSECAKSMIGDDEIYDVIILEYHLSTEDGLDILAERLRRRFPNAVIIFNMMWTPSLISGRDNNNQIISFNDIWKKHNFTRPMTNEHISTIVSEMKSFELNTKFVKDRLSSIKNIKNSINGNIFGLNQLQPSYWENKDWVEDKFSLFYDGTHFNQKGHEYVAAGIKKVLIKLLPRNKSSLENNVVVGTWGEEDSCHIWYGNGKVSISYAPQEDIKLKEFSHSKYALEISPNGGHFFINNPFSEPRPLLLSYMASAGTFDIYPKVEISLSQTRGKSYLIHPYANQYDGYQYEDDDFVMTTDVDYIPPGGTEIYIKPICSPCVLPFRLVGLSVARRHNPLITLSSPQEAFASQVALVKESSSQDTTTTTTLLLEKKESTQLLGKKPEKIIDVNDRRPGNEIRYASFGTSITWGSGLDNREKEAYVWKLSNNDHERGINYAIRSSGPNYPSSCIRSMMKDEEYDVFVLEFFMRAPEGLQTLVSRLRDRFPEAIIVIVKLWGPFQIGSKALKVHDLSLWARRNGFKENFIHDRQFRTAFFASGEHNWQYRYADHLQDALVQYIQQAARKVGAYIVELPISDHADGPEGWLALGHKFLAGDSFHMSAAGHQNIANQVKAIVDRVGVPKVRHAEPFGAIDLCYNWFTTGVVGEIIQYSPSGVVQKMPGTEKYVLSFTKGNAENKENYIRVSNPTDVELEFLIGYMSTGPPPSKYPKVTAIREDGTHFLLLPDALGWRERKVHIVRMASLGTIKPHSTVAQVTFHPLEKTEYPFRLVQVILTPAGDNNDQRTESMTNRGQSVDFENSSGEANVL